VAVADGRVKIDGLRLEEPWQPRYGFGSFGPYVVPPGEVFVLGDNRPNSNDSRHWGSGLPQERIVGKAWLSIWPPETWAIIRPGEADPANDPGPAQP
jgi:signal peptidase I